MRLYIADPKSAFEWARQARGWRRLARAYKSAGSTKNNLRALSQARMIEKGIRALANRIIKGKA